MQQSNQETYPYQADEFDLRKLAKSLKERRWFIFGFTGIVTLLAIVYVISLQPSPISYTTTTSFTEPSQSSVLSLNRFQLTSETSETIFASFLKKLSTKELQEKVFYGNDYLTALNPENETIDDVEIYVASFLSSISVNPPEVQVQSKGEVPISDLLEKPYSISMVGSNSEIISRFLNELVASANSETVNDSINVVKKMIDIRLDEISTERGLLLIRAQRDRLSQIERIKEEDGQKIREINDQIDALSLKAQRDRLSQIERIKEEDGQKIREINDQIDALRYKAQQDRLNQITILTKAAKLAGSLGIIENNLEQISDNESNFNLNIAINDDEDDLPEWYLYGEKALLEKVELLESRTSDDPFIPELITLTNQLKEVQLNNTLKTLEARQDDDPFIPELITLTHQLNEIQNNNLLITLEARQDDSPFFARINELDVEKIKLESYIVESSGINAMQLSQATSAKQILIKSRNQQMIVAMALFGGFMLSIVLAMLMNLFKEDETQPTTKTSR